MVTGPEIVVRRPGPRAWAALVAAECRMVARDTAGLVVPIGLPLLILVMNAVSVHGDQTLPGGRTVLDGYVLPLVFTVIIATVGVVNMPSFLAYYRRTGVLRRLAVTPAHPAMVLAAQVVTSLLQTIVGVGLALGVAVVAFGARPPGNPGRTVAVVALAAAAMYAVGMLVAAVAPSGNASVAIGLTAFFAMGATGGLFGPTKNLPDRVAMVGEALPFGAAVQAVGAAWAGEPPQPRHLIALAVATVVSALVAARFFRWQ
ncbi:MULTISPECIES: ABC transporter permease [unclassified Solwaraspora]|uniref:ABC transporter permease n=1 Tax=unclassified Solwaraspora TaxID=2627926 RepID=UPI00259B7363|nr:ABC transporter permease [Solwaraspora sp. WMMA2056]WJK39337.1 ABC transporter permease [Solwaraspora sp. WMMA2056]